MSRARDFAGENIIILPQILQNLLKNSVRYCIIYNKKLYGFSEIPKLCLREEYL